MPLFFLYLGGCSISKKQTNHRHFALLNVKGWTAKLTLSVTRKTQFETTRKSGCHHSIWWQVGRHVKQKHDEKRRDVISILIVQVIQWKRKGGVSFFCFSLWHIFLFLPPFLFRRRKGVLFSAWHFDAVLNVNILQLIWRGVLCVVRVLLKNKSNILRVFHRRDSVQFWLFWISNWPASIHLIIRPACDQGNDHFFVWILTERAVRSIHHSD